MPAQRGGERVQVVGGRLYGVLGQEAAGALAHGSDVRWQISDRGAHVRSPGLRSVRRQPYLWRGCGPTPRRMITLRSHAITAPCRKPPVAPSILPGLGRVEIGRAHV